MTTYKEIRGTHIKTVTSDPPAPVNGQMWYNSTTRVMKGFTESPSGAWSSGGNLNTSRYTNGGAGTRDASLIFGGIISTGNLAVTESYNGSTFSEVADLNDTRGAMGDGGTPSSAMCAAGESPGQTNASESWNGSSWSNMPTLNSARRYLAAGIESATAGVVFGGITPGSTPGTGETELYNGSAWSEQTDLNNPRRSLAGVGTSTAALCIGGYDGTTTVYTETWNGSSWTEVNDLASTTGWGGAFGTQTLALISAGTTVQDWNGTNWTSGVSNSNNLSNRSGNGTTAAGMLAGGEPPGTSGAASTEEWAAPATNTVTFTAS
jgi:hypothetical protein